MSRTMGCTTRPCGSSRPVGTTSRRQWLVAAGALAGALALLAAAPALATPLSPQDAKAVRTVVAAQLRAMADGDAERAFSYAAPAIRAQFGDAGRFMAMVTGSYPMVVRPAATVFFQPGPDIDADGTVLQVVQLRDATGKLWHASYLVARQADKQWRIAGCVVAAASSGNTI